MMSMSLHTLFAFTWIGPTCLFANSKSRKTVNLMCTECFNKVNITEYIEGAYMSYCSAITCITSLKRVNWLMSLQIFLWRKY